MKTLVALLSLALLAGCSVQTDTQVHADGTAASVAAPAGGGDGCCATEKAANKAGECCATEKADKAEKAGECCGSSCPVEAAPKQP